MLEKLSGNFDPDALLELFLEGVATLKGLVGPEARRLKGLLEEIDGRLLTGGTKPLSSEDMGQLAKVLGPEGESRLVSEVGTPPGAMRLQANEHLYRHPGDGRSLQPHYYGSFRAQWSMARRSVFV